MHTYNTRIISMLPRTAAQYTPWGISINFNFPFSQGWIVSLKPTHHYASNTVMNILQHTPLGNPCEDIFACRQLSGLLCCVQKLAK